jgi:DNA-binding beta-propeller fold protein YncE
VLEFEPSGKLIKSFGAGVFVFPNGIAVDKDGNVYVADADGKNGKGHVVVKFSPDGKVLLTLGKPGMPGDAPGYFYRPSAVAVAADGTIFVADGHGGDSNARIIKLAPDGTVIRCGGRYGRQCLWRRECRQGTAQIRQAIGARRSSTP